MRDFRWRARSRRTRTQPLLALPRSVGTIILVALVLVSCGVAAYIVQPSVAMFLADAQNSAPPTDTPAPPAPTRTPRPTSDAPISAPTGAPTQVLAEPTEEPTAIVVPTEPPADTPVPTTAPNVIAIGVRVQVGGTNGIGLSLRAEPTIQGAFLRAAPDGEILTVVDGPVQADEYTWWKVQGDQGDAGWGVADYMTLVTP